MSRANIVEQEGSFGTAPLPKLQGTPANSLPYWQCIFVYIHNIHIYCLAHVETPTAARVMAVKAKSCAGARPQFLYAESFDDGGRGHRGDKAEGLLCAGPACVSVSSGIHVSFPEPEAVKQHVPSSKWKWM